MKPVMELMRQGLSLGESPLMSDNWVGAPKTVTATATCATEVATVVVSTSWTPGVLQATCSAPID